MTQTIISYSLKTTDKIYNIRIENKYIKESNNKYITICIYKKGCLKTDVHKN